ncbi:hypothetical protein SRHO_G00089160 [Serrasalmus rhombeus]
MAALLLTMEKCDAQPRHVSVRIDLEHGHPLEPQSMKTDNLKPLDSAGGSQEPSEDSQGDYLDVVSPLADELDTSIPAWYPLVFKEDHALLRAASLPHGQRAVLFLQRRFSTQMGQHGEQQPAT